jgi:hypothetical protein
MSFGIVVKKYEHHNTAFKNWDSPKGKYIRSKRQYVEAMKREGMVPYEQAAEMARRTEEKLQNPKLELSKKAHEIIETAKLIADRKGNIKPGDRMIDAMKDVGVAIGHPQLPKHYTKEGGFE